MRKILTEVHPQAVHSIKNFHSQVVQEIEDALQKNEWVVVGMKGNPFVKKARKLLSEKNVEFHYIGHGSYFSKWKERLAIKLWSGWPTFPQVFHKGQLVGGYKDLEKYLNR